MIYGHQGGWDEILLVLVPIAAMAVLLALAKHRAERGHADVDRDVGADHAVSPTDRRPPPT